jgi:hypothetical protein
MGASSGASFGLVPTDVPGIEGAQEGLKQLPLTMAQLGGGVVFLFIVFVAWRCYKIRKARRMAIAHSPVLAAQQSVLADALPHASKASPTNYESDQLQRGAVPPNP